MMITQRVCVGVCIYVYMYVCIYADHIKLAERYTEAEHFPFVFSIKFINYLI